MNAKVIKWLSGEDLEVINPIIEERGWTPPPKSALVLACFDEQGLAGFHVLRLVPHAEPLWVRKDLRGTGLATELAAEMHNFLVETGTHGFMVIADDPAAAQLCERFGMVKVTSPVYRI